MSKKYGVLKETEIIVIRLTTDTGIVGYGESDPMPLFCDESAETVKTVVRSHLCDAILGKDPLNIQGIHLGMEEKIKGNLLAKAPFDIACYDIMGKYLNLPVHTLLGGQLRDRIPIMGALGNDEPEENAEEAIRKKEEGFVSIMIKVGSKNYLKDVTRVAAVRESVGKGYPLIVDANQAWKLSEAIDFARKIECFDISLFEQPVAYWDFEGLKAVKENTTIPISADESVFTIHDARRLIAMNAVDVFSIKVVKHGGIYNAKAIIDLAKAYGIPCLMNSMIEEGISQAASSQLGAYAENLWELGNAYFSPLRLVEDISTFSDSIRAGTHHVPVGAGLGIDIKEDVIESYQVDSFSLS
ncbi:MAG: hypothetical protein GY786_20465 [Proteobacteria bacterium]|nr:hypothetical protein [Pseudomonadota bacterium]